MDKLYTVKELSEHFKCTEQTIIRWIKSGKLNAVKVGHQWRVKGKELGRFLKDEK